MPARPVFHFNHAIVRTPCHGIVDGLRAIDTGAPDYAKVLSEHAAYVAALEAAGVAVEILPSLEAFPDSMFVEDPALVFTEGAIVMRPGAASCVLLLPVVRVGVPRACGLSCAPSSPQ